MTDLDFERELKKERLKGRYSVVVAVIGAAALMIAAVIGLYQPVKEENTALNDEISQLNDRVLQLEDRITEIKGQSEDEKNALQVRLSTLQDDNAQLTQELEQAQELEHSRNSTLSEENASLRQKISTLEKENARLKQEIEAASDDSSLQQQISTLEEENARLKQEITAAGGGSFLPSGTSYDLLTVCPPYETKKYDAPDNVTVMGITYKNAFYLETIHTYSESEDRGYAYFNLKKQYHTLEFDVGRVDTTYMFSTTLTVFLDGKAEKSVTLDPNILTPYRVSVSGIQQIRIEIVNDDDGVGGGYASFAFVNAKLYA